MYNQSKYIEELIKVINNFGLDGVCYYEKVPTNATFPYLVLIPPNTTDLSSGNLTTLDFEIYANELTTCEILEGLCDGLKNNLDNYLLNSANNFSSHISFDNSTNVRDNEQDLLARRMTFYARIFYF